MTSRDVQYVPLVAGSVRYGNVLFISGIHVNLQPAEIKSQTEHVLKTIEAVPKGAVPGNSLIEIDCIAFI